MSKLALKIVDAPKDAARLLQQHRAMDGVFNHGYYRWPAEVAADLEPLHRESP